MQYVFIDTEGGVDQESGLKTFGIVVMDGNFNVKRSGRDVYIDINTDGSKREESEIKAERQFNRMYWILREYLTEKDTYVLGFDVINDVKNLNEACERNKTKPLTFNFFDVQLLYMHVFKLNKKPKLEACVRYLHIDGKFRFHTSKSDAMATARVMQKLCEKNGKTIAQFIESHPEFTGRAEGYMAKFNIPEQGHTYQNSLMKMFKIRIDFPLLYFKKQIGAINWHGRKDGVVFYYDVILDRLYQDRHKHKQRGVGEARDDCLVFGDFDNLLERGKEKLSKEQPEFCAAPAELTVQKFIVSYECVACVEAGTLTLLHGNEYLRQVSDENGYVNTLLKNGVDPDEMIRKYYTADTFIQTLRRNTKFNYGDRQSKITVDAIPLERVPTEEGDEIYLPRVYASVLTDEFGDGEIVACCKEHFGYAPAKDGFTAVDIDGLTLPDAAIKLVVRDKSGNVFGFIPVVGKVKFPTFDCVYEIPMLIRRKLQCDPFAKLS